MDNITVTAKTVHKVRLYKAQGPTFSIETTDFDLLIDMLNHARSSVRESSYTHPLLPDRTTLDDLIASSVGAKSFICP